jgi:hypothetical protein
MPLGILRATLQGSQLREELLHDTQPIGPVQPHGRSGCLEQELLHLPPDPLRRKVAQRHPAAQLGSLGLDRDFQPRRELDAPEHPQAVLLEGSRIHGAQEPRAEICLTSPEIQQP